MSVKNISLALRASCAWARGLIPQRGFMGYVDWKHARIGQLGSSLTLGAKFSYRDTRRNIQQVLASAKWFGLKSFNRLYLETSAGAVHESHENYHNLNLNLALTPSITWDTQKLRRDCRHWSDFERHSDISRGRPTQNVLQHPERLRSLD
jgi:hypothetical protein